MDFVIWITKGKDIFDEDCLFVSKVYYNGKMEAVKDFKGKEAENLLKLLIKEEKEDVNTTT